MTYTSRAFPRGPKYVRRTLYLDGRLVHHVKRLAESESWQLADLARGMIMVGLTLRQLHEAESEIVSMKHFVTAKDALNYLVHGAVRRRYRRRGGRRGESVTVHLPAGFLKHLDMYAHSHGRSRNDALRALLQDGLLCYMFGYNHFLKGIMKSREHEAARSQVSDENVKDSHLVPHAQEPKLSQSPNTPGMTGPFLRTRKSQMR